MTSWDHGSIVLPIGITVRARFQPIRRDCENCCQNRDTTWPIGRRYRANSGAVAIAASHDDAPVQLASRHDAACAASGDRGAGASCGGPGMDWLRQRRGVHEPERCAMACGACREWCRSGLGQGPVGPDDRALSRRDRTGAGTTGHGTLTCVFGVQSYTVRRRGSNGPAVGNGGFSAIARSCCEPWRRNRRERRVSSACPFQDREDRPGRWRSRCIR